MKLKFWVILLAIILFAFYIFLPVINFNFIDLPMLLIISLLIVVFIQIKNINWADAKNIKYQFLSKLKTFKIIGFLIVGLLVYIIFNQFVFTSKMFRSSSYRNLIGTVKEGGNINNQIAPISVDKIRIVDKSLANLLGDKVMGQQVSLGSKSHIGEFTIQKINNQLYWVAPLLHSGFFKWLNNLEGTDGYVMVSATNERDVKLVQTINNKPVKIKYHPGSYLNYDLQRHVYTNGYITSGLTDFSFELDNEGKPFWVITSYTNKIGFSGSDATGVIIVDAQNGDIKQFAINATPSWVDRIQPNYFMQSQINDWGQLVKGYFNFSNEGKLQATENVKLVYGEDSSSYWYTGLTSVGSDESTVGYMLVNTRTKDAVWYKQSGATEHAAQGSAMGKVQEKGYTASDAIPYNISNIPTYAMTLKDKSGLVKMYAMVAINDYTVVGVGNTLNEAVANYKTQYYQVNNKVNIVGGQPVTQISLRTIINRFQTDIKNGNTQYLFTVDGKNNIFIGNSQLSPSIALTQKGDSVAILYPSDSIAIIEIESFKNLNLEK